MHERFRFTPGQRDDLGAPLRRRRFSAEAIADFLHVAEIEIDEWRTRTPLVARETLEEGRRRLKNVEKHLRLLRYELNTLDADWKIPLWARLREIGTSPVGTEKPLDLSGSINRVGRDAELLIANLRRAAAELIERGEGANSRDTARKVELIKTLAYTYFGCFGKQPSTTPTGPFMQTLAAIGVALGEPIGKDAGASGIAAWRREREAGFDFD